MENHVVDRSGLLSSGLREEIIALFDGSLDFRVGRIARADARGMLHLKL